MVTSNMPADVVYNRRRVEDLQADTIVMGPIDLFYPALPVDTWDIFGKTKCPVCGGLVPLVREKDRLVFECCGDQDETILTDCLNIAYPLPEDLLDGHCTMEQISDVLSSLPFALVAVHPHDLSFFCLVPLQKYLPLNREVSEAYMRLGYLPPLACTDLADEFMGENRIGLGILERWLIGAANETLRQVERAAKARRSSLKKLKNQIGRRA